MRSVSAQDVPLLGDAPLADVIAAMTTEEKARLLVGMGMDADLPGVPGMAPEDAAIPERVPGAAGRTHAVERLGIPSLTLADGPAGVRIAPTRPGDDRTYHATAFPVATLLASSWDLPLVREVGAAFGREARAYGVDVLLAPGMNLHRNPLGGRNFEYYAEDPLLSGRMAAAFVAGVQSEGVGAAVKHFAANNQEFNRMKLNTVVSRRALRELYLRGFEIAVREGAPWTVMSAYNLLNGVHTSESEALLTTILRDEWGFDGFVMTDWFAGSDPVAQVRAGNDVLMPGNPGQTRALVDAVEAGTLSAAALDTAVARVLRVATRTLTFAGHAYDDAPDLAAGARLARRAAAEGMVLLENDGDALPLARGAQLALFGNASYELIVGGTGSGDVNEAYAVPLDAGLADAGYAVDEVLRASYRAYLDAEAAKRPPAPNPLFPSPPIPERAVAADRVADAARTADAAVVVLGRNSGEFADRDRDDFVLSDVERTLLRDVSVAFRAAGRPVVVVLNVAGVVEVADWRDAADAILVAWQPGQEGGHAMADVLSGAVNPSGKLPMTFPVTYADVPSAETFPGRVLPARAGDGGADAFGVPSEVVYDEGLYVGYRYYDAFDVAPAYPFGYGLSYTDFAVEGLTLSADTFGDDLTATVEVTNTGDVAGREVVQLYLAAPEGRLATPAQELRAFAKTDRLAPGASQTLRLTLDARDLASYDPDRAAWVAAAGRYVVRVGTSSRDVRQQAAFTLPRERVVARTHDVLAPAAPVDERAPDRR